MADASPSPGQPKYALPSRSSKKLVANTTDATKHSFLVEEQVRPRQLRFNCRDAARWR